MSVDEFTFERVCFGLSMPHRFGCLRNLNKAHPGAYFSDEMFYAARPSTEAVLDFLVEDFELCSRQVSVAGDAVVGQKIEGNIPIVELIQFLGQAITAK